MREIGETKISSQVMRYKNIHLILKICNLTTTESLIVKQEMISLGGYTALKSNISVSETEITVYI